MVKVTVSYISYLREALGSKEVEYNIDDNISVEQFINDLVFNYNPTLQKYLLAEDGSFSVSMRFMLNGRDIRFLSEDKQLIQDGSILTILPPLAGG